MAVVSQTKNILEGEADRLAKGLGATHKGYMWAKTAKDRREPVAVYYVGANGLSLAHYDLLMQAFRVFEKPLHVCHRQYIWKKEIL